MILGVRVARAASIGFALLSMSLSGFVARPETTIVSIVGTTDVHGNVFPHDGRGGLAIFGGYINNLRAARAADGGAVLLVDAGDTFQGGVESNLSEGALVVDAYNALGYSALAIGNHEFDFGSRDLPGAREDAAADPRGALKALAARARFPFLAANLVDDTTGQPVEWSNTHPSVLVKAGAITVGLIGVMTADALRATLPFNVHGLRIAPLAPAIAREATMLRTAGAQIVVVAAHAGGRCARVDDPLDLSSCDDASEIFSVAHELPPGLVDVIAAGHTHDRIAHKVDGIAIVQALSGGRAFGRVDVVIDRRTGRVGDTHIFPPRAICAQQDPGSVDCDVSLETTRASAPAWYEERRVHPAHAVDIAMAQELARVRLLQSRSLDVVLDAPLQRSVDFNSPIGNLFADAFREGSRSDVAINNNAIGGPRAGLPAGPLTFGQLYDTFPFDNRLGLVTLTGEQLRTVFETAIRRGRRGMLGVSGIRVQATCTADRVDVRLYRPSGTAIAADERITVAAMDSLVLGQTFAPVAFPGRFSVPDDAPIVREEVEDWLQRRRGGTLRANDFESADTRRVEVSQACLESR
jgi:5'-nucleotidase